MDINILKYNNMQHALTIKKKRYTITVYQIKKVNR